MKLFIALLAVFGLQQQVTVTVTAFLPQRCLYVTKTTTTTIASPPTTVTLNNYLDNLNGGQLTPPPDDEQEADDSRDATKLDSSKVDRGGVGDWSNFVDFEEFDGGDGQMGVAGDGNTKLEKFDMSSVAKSRDISAKNAWGTSTGYADELIDKGVEAQRAQQLENWKNQQEVLAAKKNQRYMTDQFDNADTGEASQWNLGKFGAERTQDFDLNEEFGEVVAGDIEGTIELKANINQFAVQEFNVKNEYMGYADFRAAFTADTPPFFTIEPEEGSLDKKGVDFILRFRPQNPGVTEGYLVIETEDFKKTWKLIGGTA